MKKTREENGITLIALVITIIVLLILAGVAISMLSGENGILNKAREAKEKTEKAQQQEEEALSTMELETYFITNNLKYKCRYGYVTGISVDGNEVTEKVSDLQSKLPNGYTVCDKDSNVIANASDTKLSTGMVIQKDGASVAVIIVFGDANGDGYINVADQNILSKKDNMKDYIKIAGNVNEDKEIDANDYHKIGRYISGNSQINQNSYVPMPAEDIKFDYTKMHEYMKKVNDENKYIIKYDEKTDIYKLTGVGNTTTVAQLKSNLPDIDTITVRKNPMSKISDTDIVDNSYYLFKNIVSTISYIDNDGYEQQETITMTNNIQIEK